MKIVAPHLLNFLKKKPNLDELSKMLFQLGHEHEIDGETFDLEITPNRGDCLSLKGIARDLNYFYESIQDQDIYTDVIPKLDLTFNNQAKDVCPNISFLEVEIDGNISDYKPYLESYFFDLGINKNNFFTDISNYLAYETGQPTHCFDEKKMQGQFALIKRNKTEKFETLLNTEVELEGENLVFTLDDKLISLAGVMGGASTACDDKTTKVLIECAYFKPEEILGKARKYNLASEAAYKFERGVDYLAQEKVLRRFIKIIQDHANIKSIAIFSMQEMSKLRTIKFDHEKLNKIIGFNLEKSKQIEYLTSLGFHIDKEVVVPAHRSDVDQENDLAEEISRMIGYDNIPAETIMLPVKTKLIKSSFEVKCRNYLVKNGFYEVINFPFNDNEDKDAIEVDNPLDKQRSKMRVCLTKSLKDNLVFNQNRQKDSIRLFEISDIYTKKGSERKLGIIISGRVNKNFKEFNTLLDYAYLKGIINTLFKEILNHELLFKLESSKNYDFVEHIYCENNHIGRIGKLSKDFLDSKNKTPVFSLEVCLDGLSIPKVKHMKSSDFPASYRDLSYSLDDISCLTELNNLVRELHSSNMIMTEAFVFDYFENKKLDLLKIGYRFKFQSLEKSLTDEEVDSVMSDLIKRSLSLSGINIEGL
tara:strand:+ start:188 stop:2125 length:1938 start_codon:yes stop_codon:yes gene_type:complete